MVEKHQGKKRKTDCLPRREGPSFTNRNSVIWGRSHNSAETSGLALIVRRRGVLAATWPAWLRRFPMRKVDRWRIFIPHETGWGQADHDVGWDADKAQLTEEVR